MSLSRREFLASASALGAHATQATKKPNIGFHPGRRSRIWRPRLLRSARDRDAEPNGKAQHNHKYLYWEFHERGLSQAVRMGDWKGVKPSKRAIELYDLRRDPGEGSDCANKHPEIVAAIEKIMAEARTESKDFPT